MQGSAYMQRLAHIEALNRERLRRVDELLMRHHSPEPQRRSPRPASRSSEAGSEGLKRDSDWFLRSLSILNQRPKRKPDEIFDEFRATSPGRHEERRHDVRRRSASPVRHVRSRSRSAVRARSRSRETQPRARVESNKFFARDYSSERVLVARTPPQPPPANANATNSEVLNEKIERFIADCRRKPAPAPAKELNMRRSPSMTSSRRERDARRGRSPSAELRAADRSPDRVLASRSESDLHRDVSDRRVTYRDMTTRSAYLDVLTSSHTDDGARRGEEARVYDHLRMTTSTPMKRKEPKQRDSHSYKKVSVDPNDSSLKVQCVFDDSTRRDDARVTSRDDISNMYEDVSDTELSDCLEEASHSRRPFADRTSDARKRSRSPRRERERSGHARPARDVSPRRTREVDRRGRHRTRSEDLRVQLLRERSALDHEHLPLQNVSLESGELERSSDTLQAFNTSGEEPQHREVFVTKPHSSHDTALPDLRTQLQTKHDRDVGAAGALDSWDDFSISDDGLDEYEPQSQPEVERQELDARAFRDFSMSPDGLDDDELDDGSTVMRSSSHSGNVLPFASRYRGKQDASPSLKRKAESKKTDHKR